jgi:hypothetical protein
MDKTPWSGANRMARQDIELLADRLVSDLFVNGSGEQAHRLVLTTEDGRELGGWGQRPVRDRIVSALLAASGE